MGKGAWYQRGEISNLVQLLSHADGAALPPVWRLPPRPPLPAGGDARGLQLQQLDHQPALLPTSVGLEKPAESWRTALRVLFLLCRWSQLL